MTTSAQSAPGIILRRAGAGLAAGLFAPRQLPFHSPSRVPTAGDVPWSLLALAFALAALFSGLRGYNTVPAGGLIDPDSYMRIVRIRDGLATGWFTHVVRNDNGGAGTLVYWSHLVDAVVLALYAPLRLLLDDTAAMRWAAALNGPLFSGLLGAALVWVAAPAADRRWLWIAPFVGSVGSIVGALGVFGWVHHHLPIALTTLLCVGWAGRATQGRVDAGYWSGFWAAIGLWLSPEALPYDLMGLGAIGLAWCLRPNVARRPLAASGTALLVTVAIGTLIDPPAGGRLSPELDCLSIAYVILATFLCGAGWLLRFAGELLATVSSRLLVGTAVCAGAMGTWLALYPEVMHGLSGLMPEADARAFFGSINEMQPIRDLSSAILHLMTGALAVATALILARRQRSALWLYAALCGIVVLVLAVLYIRFAVYAQTIGAACAPIAVSLVVRRYGGPNLAHALRRVGTLALFTVAPLLPAFAWMEREVDPRSACMLDEIVPALARMPDSVLLTGINETPELLWRTPVKTVGSLYHRSIDTFLRARAIWRTGPSATVPDVVTASGVTHVLACEIKGARSNLVGDAPADALEERLARRDVPPWLHEVARAGGYSVYRVGPG